MRKKQSPTLTQSQAIYTFVAYCEQELTYREQTNGTLTVYELALQQAVRELREAQERHDELTKKIAQRTGAIRALKAQLGITDDKCLLNTKVDPHIP